MASTGFSTAHCRASNTPSRSPTPSPASRTLTRTPAASSAAWRTRTLSKEAMKKLTLSSALLALVLSLAANAANAADGQTATLLRDINTTNDDGPSGGFGSAPEHFAVLGERAIFRGGDESTGEELWVTDGTSAGTRILEDICPGTCSSGPYPLGVINGVALLLADPEQHNDWYLWRSDGTEAGTYPLDVP